MNKINVDQIVKLQETLTINWHIMPPSVQQQGLLELIESNHMENFNLWHKEDEARRNDMGFEYVYHAKRNIDKFNQLRNNYMEKIDRYIVDQLNPLPQTGILHTETPGMIIDRLSILALKKYHMKEEAERNDAPQEQRQQCAFKFNVIQQQLLDLSEGLKQFLKEISEGKRHFKVYYQFKMYNDPNLNPQLYQQQAASIA